MRPFDPALLRALPATRGPVALLSLVALYRARPGGPRRGMSLALFGLVVGLLLIMIPWSWTQRAQGAPPIHDITTDTQDPPQFVADLKGAKSEELFADGAERGGRFVFGCPVQYDAEGAADQDRLAGGGEADQAAADDHGVGTGGPAHLEVPPIGAGQGGCCRIEYPGLLPPGLTPAASMNQPCATALTADAHPGGPAGRTELLPVRLPTSGVAF